MKTRVISGLVMIPLLAILYFGGYVLTAACFLIGIMGVREFYERIPCDGSKTELRDRGSSSGSTVYHQYIWRKIRVVYAVVLWRCAGEHAVPVQHRTSEAGRCHGDHHRYFLCGVFLIPCDAGGSGRSLRTDAVAHSDNGVWNGYHGIFFRISAGKT